MNPAYYYITSMAWELTKSPFARSKVNIFAHRSFACTRLFGLGRDYSLNGTASQCEMLSMTKHSICTFENMLKSHLNTKLV